MALINKLFARPFQSSQALNTKSDSCLLPSKKQIVRQRYPTIQTTRRQRNSLQNDTNDDSASWVPNRSEAAQIRLLVFRECEVRGRRLIFDSGGGSAERHERQETKSEFHDDHMIKDMVFGSATLKCSGDNYRFHDFGPSLWKGYEMMLTKVFLVPPVPVQPPVKHEARRAESKGTLASHKLSLVAKDSGYMEGTDGSENSLALASATSSQASIGSFSLTLTRSNSKQKAVSDSLLVNGNQCLSNGQHLQRNRKVRLAVALLFLPKDPSKEISMWDIIREQFGLVEHFVQRLQFGVLRAYWNRKHFHNFIQEAIVVFERDLNDVLHFPKDANPPAYVALARLSSNSEPEMLQTACTNQQQVAERFMVDWESVVNETETKLTRFFWSSLLSAVLTYHVNWLHSYVSEPVEFRDCGTRVLVLSKNPDLAKRLLHVMSFFVRLGVLVEAAQPAGSPVSHPSPARIIYDSGVASSATANISPTGYNFLSRSIEKLQVKVDGKVELPIVRTSSSERRITCLGNGQGASVRRGSHQLENSRYLRNYYDVRFQLSPDTIAKKTDGKPFANLMSSIAKHGFHDFYADETADSGTGGESAEKGCAFFVGSVPDQTELFFENAGQGACDDRTTESQPIRVEIPSVAPSSTTGQHPHLLRWFYGTELDEKYQSGRTIQSCDPSKCDWLRELQLDLRAASTRTKSVSCVVANTDTWEVQVLTSTRDESYPPRIKQSWAPVTMSGQVANIVESTQLLWSMLRNSKQCVEHVDSRLRFLCRKSEDLGAMLSASIQSWNVERITRLLGIEPPDLPLLMAACSVHSPVVTSMGGVTVL